MGAWGIGIHQNDVSEDLKDTYLNYLKAGKTDEEALEETLEEYEDEIEDADDSIDVYISLADVMWKKGRLTKEIKEKALEMIEKERTYGRWDEKALKKRMAVLEKFKEQILSPMPERKKYLCINHIIWGLRKAMFFVLEFQNSHINITSAIIFILENISLYM